MSYDEDELPPDPYPVTIWAHPDMVEAVAEANEHAIVLPVETTKAGEEEQ